MFKFKFKPFTESVLRRKQFNEMKTFFFFKNGTDYKSNIQIPSNWVGSEKIIMTMRCHKTIYVCILYMYVHTHIFIISKYVVKDTQVFYYITESMSVRPGKWRRTIFALNVDVFRLVFFFIKSGVGFFRNFSPWMTEYNFHIKSKSWLSIYL